MADQITARDLIDAGFSRSFAHFVAKGERKLSVSTALWLLDKRGIKAGPLADCSPKQVEFLRGMHEPRGPKSASRH